jgi:secreted trypsin-like serine protease
VCFDKQRQSYVQVGIVAWGVQCGQAGIPGVYADVVRQTEWINSLVTDYFGMDVPYFDLRSNGGASNKGEGTKPSSGAGNTV